MATRTDELLSKGMGKAKAVKARLSGLVGLFGKLAEQHGQVSAMLKRVQSNVSKRAELWPLIRRDLLAHEHAELQTLYPELRQHDMTRLMAEDHDREAGQLEELIHRLDQANIQSDEWGRLLSELIGKIEHHVAEEEKSIFPRAQDVLGEDRARELEKEFLAVFEKQQHLA